MTLHTTKVRLASAGTADTNKFADRENMQQLGKNLREESPKRFNVLQAEMVRPCDAAFHAANAAHSPLTPLVDAGPRSRTRKVEGAHGLVVV